eukprot:gene6132-biopygen9656
MLICESFFEWFVGAGQTAVVGLSLVIYGFWGFLVASVPLRGPFSLRRLAVVLVIGCIYGPLWGRQRGTHSAVFFLLLWRCGTGLGGTSATGDSGITVTRVLRAGGCSDITVH